MMMKPVGDNCAHIQFSAELVDGSGLHLDLSPDLFTILRQLMMM